MPASGDDARGRPLLLTVRLSPKFDRTVTLSELPHTGRGRDADAPWHRRAVTGTKKNGNAAKHCRFRGVSRTTGIYQAVTTEPPNFFSMKAFTSGEW